MEKNFVDYVKICCRSGAGGSGYVHFHRDKKTAKGDLTEAMADVVDILSYEATNNFGLYYI